MSSTEKLLAESTVHGIAVRFIQNAAGQCFAAGAPVENEWCYLADSWSLAELEVAVELVLGDAAARGVFERCAALLGVEWQEPILPLLAEQERSGQKLSREAPDTAEADIDDLRQIRKQAAEEA